MRVARACAAAALASFCAGAAHATIVGRQWRQRDVNANQYGGPSPMTDPQVAAFAAAHNGIVVLDLYLIGNQAGETINGINFGFPGSADPYGIFFNGSVFNHSVGGDARITTEAALQPIFPGVLLDTYATFGGDFTTVGASVQFAGPVNMGVANGEIRYTSFTQPPVAFVPSSNPAGAELWILQVAVGGDTTFFHGVVQIGLAGGALQDMYLLFPPAPGPAALLGIAGLACARRRR